MRSRKPGFTLIEVLVVLALIALLGALLVFVLPGFRDRQRAANGGQALQGWLTYARQRALQERAPRGLRLLFKVDPQGYATNPGPTIIPVIEECQYLEQPEDYTFATAGRMLQPGANLLVPPPPAWQPDPNVDSLQLVQVQGADFSDGSVQEGDYLEILGTGQVHHIGWGYKPLDLLGPGLSKCVTRAPFKYAIERNDPQNNPTKYDQLVLASKLTSAPAGVTNYRIIRKPRVAGDDAMKMPAGVIIDAALTMNLGFACSPAYLPAATPRPCFSAYTPATLTLTNPNVANEQGYIDIMFGPGGNVLEPTGDKIILWVRTEPQLGFADAPLDAKTSVNPTLIVIYTNSGAIAAYDPQDAAKKTGTPFGLIR